MYLVGSLIALTLFILVLACWMAAPTVTARQAPVGYRLPEGFKSVITFANNPDISLWEITTKPPGIDGGDPVDFNSMHNLRWRMQRARKLKTVMPVTFKFGYNPNFYDDIIAQVNSETSITHTWPQHMAFAYYGYLQKVEFDDLEEGKPATGTGTIIATNWDPVNNVEADPVTTEAAGTP